MHAVGGAGAVALSSAQPSFTLVLGGSGGCWWAHDIPRHTQGSDTPIAGEDPSLSEGLWC